MKYSGVGSALAAALFLEALKASSVFGAAVNYVAKPITPGDLVVYHVGSTSSSARQVFLDEYTTTGTLVQEVAVDDTVPAAGTSNPQYALTAGGSASNSSQITEGQLTLSPNGQYITLTGYNVGGTGSNNTSSTTSSAGAAGAVSRTIGILNVSAGGAVDTSTSLNNAFDLGPIRAAVTTDGTNIYAVGGPSTVAYGIWSTTKGSTTATQLNGGKEFYVAAQNGHIYVSDTSQSTNGIFQLSGGLSPAVSPTYTTTTSVLKPSGGSPSTVPEAFSFASVSSGSQTSGVPDTLYVADEVYGYVDKYVNSGSGFALVGATQQGSLSGIEGLTTQTVPAPGGGVTVNLFATTAAGIFSLSDTPLGTFNNSTFNPLVMAADTSISGTFRGIIYVPEPASSTFLMGTVGSLLLKRKRRGVTA